MNLLDILLIMSPLLIMIVALSLIQSKRKAKRAVFIGTAAYLLLEAMKRHEARKTSIHTEPWAPSNLPPDMQDTQPIPVIYPSQK